MCKLFKSLTYVLDFENTETKGHCGGVNVVKYNNNAKTLFTGGRDGTVKLWSNANGNAYENAKMDSYNLKSFSSSNNIEVNNQNITDTINKINKKGLSFYREHSPTSYSLSKSEQLHADWVNDIELINDESLVSCSSDLLLKLWNHETGAQTNIGYHTDYVQCVAVQNSSFRDNYSTLENWIASGGLDKNVNLWDLNKYSKIGTYTISGQEANLNYYNNQSKGSIYALSANNNLIAVGGTDNKITLLDRRSQKSQNQLIGHTDAIKSLVISDEWLLSGSADTTIKLWSLKNNRVFKTFDMHNSSVWSLHSNYKDFKIFYSGDKSGYILKTDLRGCFLDNITHESDSRRSLDYNSMNESWLLKLKLNDNLGVVSVVGKQNCGVTSIVAENLQCKKNEYEDDSGYIWCSSSNESSTHCFLNPDFKDIVIHQYLAMKNSILSLLKSEIVEKTLEDESSSRISQEYSKHSLDEKISSTIFDSIDDNLSDKFSNDGDYDDSSEEDSELIFETSFVNVNGTPNTYYLNQNDYENISSVQTFGVEVLSEAISAKDATLIPINYKSFYSITGGKCVRKARLLNNRRHLITLDDEGIVCLWNITTSEILKKFTNSMCEEILEDERNGVFYEKDERFFEDIIDEYQTNETVPNWCQVTVKTGKVYVTIKEHSFTNCEVYLDELTEIIDSDTIESIKLADPNWRESRWNLGKMVLKSLFYNFEKHNIYKDGKFRSDLIDGKILPEHYLKRDNFQYLEYISALQGVTSPLLNSNNNSNSTSADKEKEKDGGLKKLNIFSRKKKEEKEPPAIVRKESFVQQSQTANRLKVATIKLEDPLSSVDYEDTLSFLLDSIKLEYLKSSNSKDLNNSVLNCPGNLDVPVIKHLVERRITILINEQSKALKGNCLTLYRFFSDNTNFKDENQYDKMVTYIPKWVGECIFKNEYPLKETKKVTVKIMEWREDNDSKTKKSDTQKKNFFSITVPLTGTESLPPLINPTNVVFSYDSMERVRKVMNTIVEKFQAKTSEMKKMGNTGKSIPIESWLELLCNDEVLSPISTLNTVQNKIWKKSDTVVIMYRRKASNSKK